MCVVVIFSHTFYVYLGRPGYVALGVLKKNLSISASRGNYFFLSGGE